MIINSYIKVTGTSPRLEKYTGKIYLVLRNTSSSEMGEMRFISEDVYVIDGEWRESNKREFLLEQSTETRKIGKVTCFLKKSDREGDDKPDFMGTGLALFAAMRDGDDLGLIKVG